MRSGQEQVEDVESSTVATVSLGHEAGTEGKSWGMAPSATSASLHRNAFPTLLETYTSCLVERAVPAATVVLISTHSPPSTPISSEMAPRIDNVTGKMSFLAIPIARAVRKGIMLL